MSSSSFIDLIRVYTESGHGGPGSVHYHREKFIDKGGPDGGDGGRGGHVILKGNRNLWTLLHLRYKKHLIAERGEHGKGNNKTGREGVDLIIDVPVGTIARDEETGKLLCEVTAHDEECIIRKGGRGGKGNSFFKKSTHQTPRFSQPGEPGEEGWVVLELKMLADVGLVGFPNAGKSTLLSVVSAARPKIADYAFTTLIPNVGIVNYMDYNTFVMADIPGIIEGASEGKGLGLRFLRHIERNSTLLFLIPCTSENVKKEYKILLNELKKYNPELLNKERILGISKTDLMDEVSLKKLKTKLKMDCDVIFFSSITGDGVETLKKALWTKLNP
ncbi:MAG: GTPase ObgE [Bacteroidetes bacterium HGW-Bacteroidetes-21]|jgi:GTP-binding protein|nr:MAG: GTPase ObgE [Bacteroidetes bacterium HGW-Bacteroidetes-21]